MSEEAPPEIEEKSGEEVVSSIDTDTTVKPEIVPDDVANDQSTTEPLESTNEPKDRSSPAPEPTQVHVFAEKQSKSSSRGSPAQVESPPRSNVQSPKPQETSDQKPQETKDEESKNFVDVAIQYEPYFERVESSRNAAEGDSAAQTLISRPPKKVPSKKERKQKQGAAEEKPHWSVQRPSKPERPPTPESIASRASKKHRSGRRLWGRYRPVSNDERLAYKYAELKSLLTEDFVVNADDLIDRQVEETKQVLQNYVSMRRVFGDTSLDGVHSRGLESADERLRESREHTSRRRRALFGRRSEESQYNAAATVDLGPLPPHKRSEHHPLESISFPSPNAKLRARKSSSDHSPPPANAERERTPQPPPEPKPDEITIDTDGEPERPEHEAKPTHEAKPEPHEPSDHVSSSSATAFTTAARRAPPKPSSAAREREREREREEGGSEAAQEMTAEQQFSARVAVPFGLEPPENLRERPRSDNQLGDTNNPSILKWLTYKNKVLRRQQLEDIHRKKREKELERSKKAEDEAHKRVAEEAFKRWLEIKEEERLLASRGRTNRAQLGHQEEAKHDGEGEAKSSEDEEGGKSDGEKDPEEAELEQTAQGRMRGSVRPRGNYFFQRRAPWRGKSAPSFSSDGQRVRMSLVGRQSVLSSRPGTALTGRASAMAEAAAGPTVTAGELLGEGVSPEGERALEEQRSRVSGSGVGVQVTSSEALRRKRHSYQEWLAKKRAELVERRRREEEAKRALVPNFDADLMGIVPEVARKRIQDRRDQKRRVDTNLRRPQSAADEQHVRPGLGYPSPPPNIHYLSNEPPIPGTRQKLWDQRMTVVTAYTRPITLPSELPSEAGGEPASAPPKQTPAAAAPEAPKPPLALEAQPKTPKQTCIDRRVEDISELQENPDTQAKQVFDWMPPPAGSARAKTQVPFGARPEGVEPLNLQADESSSSPKSGPSSLSPSAKSPPSVSVSSAHTAAQNKAVTSPKAESSQPTPAHSSQQPQVAASASGFVPHPPATPPARDTRSTPRRSRPIGAAAAPTAGAGAGAGAGAETEPASRQTKPSEALKSRPGDWIDTLSEFVGGAKKEGEPRADAAAPEAGSPAESINTPHEAHSPDIEKRPLELESNSSADLGLSLFRPKEQQPSQPSPAREAPDETNELRGTAEEAISSAATSSVTADTATVPVVVKETLPGRSSSRVAETGSEAAVAASNSPPEQSSSPPLERNESPSSPAAAAALISPSQQQNEDESDSTKLKPPASPPPAAESGEGGKGEDEAAEMVEDAPEIEAAAESDEEDLGNKSLFM